MSTADTDPQTMSAESDPDHGADGHGHGEKASYDDINVPVILMVGFVSTVLTFVCICGVQALYYHYESDQIRRKEYDIVHTPNTEITDEQKAKLLTYGHTVVRVGDTETRRITVPVDKTYDSVIQTELANQQGSQPPTGD